MAEVTRVLPPGDEKALDCDVVADLIRAAIRRTLEDLGRLVPPQRLEVVALGSEKAAEITRRSAPNYRDRVVWDAIADVWRSPEAQALTDHIWERGALKKTITGPDPDKESWARFVYGDLVHTPMLLALENTAREYIVVGREVMSWQVSPDYLEGYIAEAVRLYCGREQLAKACCPLDNVKVTPGDSFRIAPDIQLVGWPQQRRLLFISRWASEFVWDDFKSPFVLDTIAEIQLPIPILPGTARVNVSREVQDRLDVLKWALFITGGGKHVVGEGSCLIVGLLESRLGRFRRDDNMGGGELKVDAEIAKRCCDLVREFREAAALGTDLNSALWHFGRASTAALPRDILLESAVGIDLLVGLPGGDSRYRFCLHGAGVLAQTPGEGPTIYGTLQEIYAKRSAGAHGRSGGKVEALAIEARALLGRMIARMVAFILERRIDPRQGIAKGVERWVLGRVTAG